MFLCTKALRDEGTSYHYISHGKYSYPDKKLTEQFSKFLKKKDLNFSEGVTWTIDAPYRETKAEIKKYAKFVSTVEMEASALFAVATVRKVRIAAAFFTSDILGKTWDNRINSNYFKRGIDELFDNALEFLL